MNDDIRAHIKQIQIFTKRLVSNSLSGDYLSAFKGSGMEFHQIREYNQGDDVRHIDWNHSAKSGKLMVKQFIEERDRTIILMVDISSSGNYASNLELKRELIAKVASSLALIANESNDRIGAIFFSDRIEKWIKPGRGMSHVSQILEAILTLKPKGKSTSIHEALKFLINLKKNNFVIFMLSDFIDDEDSYSKLLKVASCKHDFIGMRISDPCESDIPDVGFLELLDPESGDSIMVDTKDLNKTLQAQAFQLQKTFEKYKIDLLSLSTNKPFAPSLVRFFKQRIRRSI